MLTLKKKKTESAGNAHWTHGKAKFDKGEKAIWDENLKLINQIFSSDNKKQVRK